MTDGQYDAVQQAVAELQSTRVQQASKSIEQHAQDVCKVDLGPGLGASGGLGRLTLGRAVSGATLPRVATSAPP